MSIKLMSEVFRTPLPAIEKLVLLALADFANDEGECFPSVSALTLKCSTDEASLNKVIGELEKKTYLRLGILNHQYVINPTGDVI